MAVHESNRDFPAQATHWRRVRQRLLTDLTAASRTAPPVPPCLWRETARGRRGRFSPGALHESGPEAIPSDRDLWRRHDDPSGSERKKARSAGLFPSRPDSSRHWFAIHFDRAHTYIPAIAVAAAWHQIGEADRVHLGEIHLVDV